MALTPATFKDAYDNTLLDMAKIRETTYQVTMYKQLGKLFPALTGRVINILKDSNIKYPEQEIKHRVNDPVFSRLFIKKLANITLNMLFQTTKVNRPLTAIAEIDAPEYPLAQGRGLIFPVLNRSNWIIHNLGFPEDTLIGRSRLIIYSRSPDIPDIWVEPLVQFINDRRGT